MKPFEIRLMVQHARNEEHLKNLRAFVENKTRFELVSPTEQILLLEQIDVMATLDEILTERMDLHNLPH